MNGKNWKYTTVSGTENNEAFCASLARSLHRLNWRRHGIGCLQAYLREGEDHEVRVHIWHPSIVREGMVDHGDLHNHRFRMVSTVLFGEIEHTEADITDDVDGEWYVYHVVHARQDIGARYQHDSAPGSLGTNWRRVSVARRPGIISAGETYEFARGEFHHTRVDGLAVTIVTKLDQTNDRARIVAKPEPVHAFEVDDPFDTGPAVLMAELALLGEVTA